MSMSRGVGLLIGVAIAAASASVSVSACAGEGAGVACGPSEALVARVIDGDTIELAGGELVRYLMVDAPESTGGAVECWGDEAHRLNELLVAGQRVTLAYDDAACRDRFDRLLAYVAVDGREVNRLLVERGYACVLFLPPAGAGRRDELEAAESAARAAAAGLWGACAQVPCE